MALTVNTKIASMSALTQLNQSNRALSGTLERISTGLRINSAADDAAGLAVAENLDAQSRSLSVAARNTNDGIAIIQTAESASSEVSNILKRMRELAVQSASDTLGDPERAYIQEEFLGLSAEIDRIAAVTEFNGVSLADGSAPTISVQVGINNTVNDQIDITLGDLRAATMGVDVGSVDMSSAAGASAALTAIDGALDQVATTRSGFGAVQNRFESTLRHIENYQMNLASAESQIRDADFAKEAAELAKHQTMQQAGIASLAQATSITQAAVQLIS